MTAFSYESYLPAVVIIPLLAGVAAVVLKGRANVWLGVGSCLLLVALSLHLAFSIQRDGTLRYPVAGWGSPLGIDLYVDGLNALMLILTAIVGLAVSIFAVDYFSGAHSNANGNAGLANRFWPLWLFLIAGLNALFVSADLFNLYVTLEIITIAAVALVALEGTPIVLRAALRYLLLGVAGSLAYLVGVALLYSAHGRLDLVLLSEVMEPEIVSWGALAALSVGLMVKAALFPLHVWLPPAHANAPAPVSAALSGLVITSAFYVFARFWFTIFQPVVRTVAVGHLLGVLGSIAIVWGGLQAIRQTRLKLLIAYSTVSQIGYPFVLFALLTPEGGAGFAWSGGVFFAAAHGFAKGAAFLAAGVIMLGFGHDRVKELNDGAHRYPIAVMALALAGVNLMGLPPSGGFVAKWMLLKAALLSGQWMYATVMIAGSLLAACYIFRALEATLSTAGTAPPKQEVSWRMQASALGLAFVAILLGHLAVFPVDILGVGAPILVGAEAP